MYQRQTRRYASKSVKKDAFTVRRNNKWPKLSKPSIDVDYSLELDKEISQTATKAWERHIADLMAKEHYKEVTNEHSRLAARRGRATPRIPPSYTEKELKQLSMPERSRHERRWDSYKLSLVRPRWKTLQLVMKAHVMTKTLSSAIRLYVASLPYYFGELKATQLLAYTRDLLLMFLAEESNLNEIPAFSPMLHSSRKYFESHIWHGNLLAKDMPALFSRPVEMALLKNDFGTALALIQELYYYHPQVQPQVLAKYTEARLKALDADKDERMTADIAFEIRKLLEQYSDASHDEISMSSMPDELKGLFKFRNALLFPEEGEEEATIHSKEMPSAVWPHTPFDSKGNKL